MELIYFSILDNSLICISFLKYLSFSVCLSQTMSRSISDITSNLNAGEFLYGSEVSEVVFKNDGE
jgi:hypothetical protein